MKLPQALSQVLENTTCTECTGTCITLYTINVVQAYC